MNHPRLVIAGTHSGVGKTTITLALMSAWRAKGKRVQPFKVGPDFLDPMHHRAVTGRESRNLDGWMLDGNSNRTCLLQSMNDADLAVIEGMMGLFDGSSSIDEQGSTAQMAKQLDAPVLLVVDGSAMARSAAALVKGYATFDPKLRVCGVLFNRVNSEGHYQLLKSAVESSCDIGVVGYFKSDPALQIEDRHLGLASVFEDNQTDLYQRLGDAAETTIDWTRLEAILEGSSPIQVPRAVQSKEKTKRGRQEKRPSSRSLRIGVAHDAAFCFYYQGNLDCLREAGAEIVFFSPLQEKMLPAVDLLYLGGGYPELHAKDLSRNQSMQRAILDFALSGKAVYAECGGLMYLTEFIQDFSGDLHSMVGVFPFQAVMDRSKGMIGYRTVEVKRDCLLGVPGVHARGHEFHYSYLRPGDSTQKTQYACMISNATQSMQGPDGLVLNRTLALYTHIHFGSQPSLAHSLVNSAQ